MKQVKNGRRNVRRYPINILITAYIPPFFPGRRVDWFRAWAAKERTDEEVNLLYADGRAARRGFLFAANLWDSASERHSYLTAGARAYAMQKCQMFRQMALEVEESVTAAHSWHVDMIDQIPPEDDDGLKKVYLCAQAHQIPQDDKLDYSLVRNTSRVPTTYNADIGA